MKNNFNSM